VHVAKKPYREPISDAANRARALDVCLMLGPGVRNALGGRVPKAISKVISVE
jgi:hypothetical protein